QMIRIVIADGQGLSRAGIRYWLSEMPDVQIVGEASNGRECLELIAELKPDLVLMDLAMPKVNGLDVARTATQQQPKLGVIIFTSHPIAEHVRQALASGTRGLLSKDDDPAELKLAVQTVANGGVHLSRGVSDFFVSTV